MVSDAVDEESKDEQVFSKVLVKIILFKKKR